MRNRSIHSRKAFQLESLETRNAPSHFGGLAHAAAAIHRAPSHTAAPVRHFRADLCVGCATGPKGQIRK